MTIFTIDLVYEKETGNVEMVVDWNDPSMTMADIEDGIEDGSLVKTVISQVREIMGDEMADQIADGRLPLVCLDKDRNQKREISGLLQKIPLADGSDGSTGSSRNAPEAVGRLQRKQTLKNEG